MENPWTSFGVFSEHRVIKVADEEMVFGRSSLGKSGLWFILVVSGALFLSAYFTSEQNSGKWFLAGVIGILVTSTELFLKNIQKILDKKNNSFSIQKGFWRPKLVAAEKAELNNLHAIQLLSMFVFGRGRKYGYELNLVLKNGNRLYICQYQSHDKLIEDAEMCAKFLNLPIWNAIGEKVNFW